MQYDLQFFKETLKVASKGYKKMIFFATMRKQKLKIWLKKSRPRIYSVIWKIVGTTGNVLWWLA